MDAIEEITAVTAKKIFAQPNAGFPREVNGRQMYMASPDYMAKYAKRLIHKGVKFLGGCCGTTPEHIKVMADAVRPLSPRRSFVVIEHEASAKHSESKTAVLLAERSHWGKKIAAGDFVTTIEITPPIKIAPITFKQHLDFGTAIAGLRVSGGTDLDVTITPTFQINVGLRLGSGLSASQRFYVATSDTPTANSPPTPRPVMKR